jgi:hypothetical protein
MLLLGARSALARSRIVLFTSSVPLPPLLIAPLAGCGRPRQPNRTACQPFRSPLWSQPLRPGRCVVGLLPGRARYPSHLAPPASLDSWHGEEEARRAGFSMSVPWTEPVSSSTGPVWPGTGRIQISIQSPSSIGLDRYTDWLPVVEQKKWISEEFDVFSNLN